MKQSKPTETQIVSIFKQSDTGVPGEDVYQRAVTMHYQWRSRYGDMAAADSRSGSRSWEQRMLNSNGYAPPPERYGNFASKASR
jgi:hypothetical protein